MLTNGDGRVAFVTGGARGIGQAIVSGLAEDGLAVVIADLRLSEAQDTAEAILASGGQALAVELDVTSAATTSAGSTCSSTAPDGTN
jgi:NAD(P)-dependent dehydrogenase (short-subunit alcohol dehydrogenase family)